MPCDEYRALVTQRARGPLPEEQERLLQDHLPDCRECRRAVALQELDDAAVHDALLGLPNRDAGGAASARSATRAIVVPAVLLALVLFGLWALYGSFERAAAEKQRARMSAAALDRTVMPRSLRRDLPVVLADFADQVGAPVEMAGDPAEPIEVTFVLERRIRLRSALSLLARFHRVDFVVGEDRAKFPGATAETARPAEDLDLDLRLRSELVTLNYAGDRLAGALQYIDDLKGINLVVAPEAVAKVAATPARLEVRDEALGDVLSGLLKGTGLGWTVRHECVVIGAR
ncbi:MAG: zf-HC2 domain-containing protein [Planctomycetota bacterium]